MADFNKAFEKTMHNEGYYTNDKQDVGGETYCGIPRNYHPSWIGWPVVDNAKTPGISISELNKKLTPNIDLHLKVKSFYKETYWNIFLGDQIKYQDIAEELFDTGVNMNHIRSITFLQKGLNVLNRCATIFQDLVEDGQFGMKTMTALNLLPPNDIPVLLKIMNILQGMHYIEYMGKSPNQEVFARGWFERVYITKG